MIESLHSAGVGLGFSQIEVSSYFCWKSQPLFSLVLLHRTDQCCNQSNRICPTLACFQRFHLGWDENRVSIGVPVAKPFVNSSFCSNQRRNFCKGGGV